MKKLPNSYLSGTLTSGHGGGATVHLHFSSVDEAEQWFNGLTAESAEQREQGQAVVGYLVEGWHEGKVIARQMYDAVDDALQTASVFARHYPTVTTKPLYTTPPTPPAGVPDGYVLVPVEPTPEMIAAAAVAVLPNPSAKDFELARKAARIVLAHPNAPPTADFEFTAAAMATIIPAHRAMLSAAPQPAAQTQEREAGK